MSSVTLFHETGQWLCRHLILKINSNGSSNNNITILLSLKEKFVHYFLDYFRSDIILNYYDIKLFDEAKKHLQ